MRKEIVQDVFILGFFLIFFGVGIKTSLFSLLEEKDGWRERDVLLEGFGRNGEGKGKVCLRLKTTTTGIEVSS